MKGLFFEGSHQLGSHIDEYNKLSSNKPEYQTGCILSFSLWKNEQKSNFYLDKFLEDYFMTTTISSKK